ncbi:hypothetical protein B4900_00165 [Yersinia rohdei]|nr:hypothetical protein B4900_00165 [Yersinia rohdei]
MRITTSMMATVVQQSASNSNAAQEKLSRQINSHRKVIVPSDDPIASTWMAQLEQEQSAIEQYQQNITRLNNSLSKQEKSVTALKNELTDIKDELLSAASDSRGSLDMASYGNSIGARLETIVTFLNSKSGEGRYIFSGTNTDTSPVSYDATTGEYSYAGNSDYRETTTANGINVRENIHIHEAFGLQSVGGQNTLTQLKALCEDMKNGSDKSTYSSKLQDALGLVDDATNYLAATETELGSRKNRTELLSHTHTENAEANSIIASELVGLNMTQIMEKKNELTKHQISLQFTFQIYAEINKLSLFNFI